jgi:hypothetical protein
MTAWQSLLLKSSLINGTAWQHINSTLLLGGGLTINDGVYVDYDDMTIDAMLDDGLISVELDAVEVIAEIDDNQILIEVCE